MGVLLRAVAYATLFIGFVLVFLPARVLSRAGVVAPIAWGTAQVSGTAVGAVGAAIAVR